MLQSLRRHEPLLVLEKQQQKTYECRQHESDEAHENTSLSSSKASPLFLIFFSHSSIVHQNVTISASAHYQDFLGNLETNLFRLFRISLIKDIDRQTDGQMTDRDCHMTILTVLIKVTELKNKNISLNRDNFLRSRIF